jgi:hypothetical protein
MKYLLPAALPDCVRVDEIPTHPSQLHTEAAISPIRYGCRSSFAQHGAMLILLRFGTSTLYRIGAMMGEAELALGVNVVE